jgi:hypothetical protein
MKCRPMKATREGEVMRKILMVLVVAVLFAGSALMVHAEQCMVDLDCGFNGKCVGNIGSRVCVPK